jgi:hypothetical protein
MVTSDTETVTVDRISNSGNPIAQQQVGGKTIHVPAGDVGETLEVELVDSGGYFIAQLVNRANESQPRQPSISSSPDISADDGELGRSRPKSHSFKLRSSPAGGKLRGNSETTTGKQTRDQLSRRKK